MQLAVLTAGRPLTCSSTMTPVILMSLVLMGALAQHGTEWTYSEGALDEEHWPREYPACGGKRQSPINLQRKKVQYNPSLKALNLTGYEAQGGEFPMTNNGHTVQISLPPTMRMTASDGTEYVAQQMHFHWGGASSEISGSEHTIDGIRYVSEIHVVHYNSKYSSYNVAKSAPDGLAVLAALVEVKEYAENTYYSNFISHLKNIRHPGQSTVLSGLDIQDMLPENLYHYYSYQGSLTTPPCTENVQWFLLADTVRLSRAQIRKLENSLLDYQNKVIRNDYRRTQPLNNRVVEANFMYHRNPQHFLGSELQFYLRKIESNLEYLRRYIEQKRAKRKSKYD
ncbi:carbonic anhydrase 6 [Pteronotus mesoamericanus]|uniref:carbonic anhydrase 6 n=1 Tax=Pteronotus mesoamericanus TaxID=1884717 RepID=UPI0023EE26CA|nr:carbonic anhydrase 6 [Pteronotus parnellii mesoamericanus]